MSNHRILSVLVASLVSLTGCGSGGGGDDEGGNFVGAANVALRVSPSRIDSGDRALIETEVSDVHENGISLKFRYAESLRYVPKSAVLVVNQKEIDLVPTVNAVSEDEGIVYLVFYLKQASFTKAGQTYKGEGGTVQLQLEGLEALEDGKIEVDADVDDPAENNAKEFDIEAPEFVAADEAEIRVLTE